MTDELEFGLFAVDADTRTVRGIIIPWNETSRVSSTKNAPLTFRPGDIRVPRDHTVVGLNKQHDRYDPLGRAAKFDETHERGLYSEWVIADTEEGDAWLADHGDLVRLSPELRDITRNADGTASATLTGAALVDAGAFASAGLFAVDDEEETAVEAPAPTESAGEPAEEEEEETVADATVPTGLPAPKPVDVEKKETGEFGKNNLSFGGFVNALHAARTAGDAGKLAPYLRSASEVGLFELTDVVYDTAGVSAFTQNAWLGELWRAVPEVRTFIPAIGSSPLTDLKMTGFTLDVGPDAIDEWLGNKNPIPSDAVTLDDQEFTAQRFAGGNDLAREYWDFNKTQVIEAYIRKMVELYQRKSDAYALAQVLAGATTTVPGTVPSGADAGMTAVIDLALAVQAEGGTPNVVRVAPNLYRSMLLQLDGNQFAYLSASFGLPNGEAAGLDIRADARLAASQILVADRNGAGVWELPGSPIRVDAVNVVNGGIDKGFFGYIAAGVIDPGVVRKATLGA